MHNDTPARRLAVATSDLSAGINPDDELFVAALREMRVAVTPAKWNDAGVDWSAFDAILIRSIWDYFRHYTQYLQWLDHLERLRVPTINPNRVLRWNSDKRYLLQLPPLGVEIIATQVARKPELPNVLAASAGREVVVKPTVSATSWHTVRGIVGSATFSEAVAGLPSNLDYLVQPYMPEIVSGEISVLFFGGEYSHAVRKEPAANDYRVQNDFGGTSTTITPDAGVLSATRHALAAVGELGYHGSYARIDGVVSGGRFLIMEIEMIEPSLFLSGNATASRRFAAVIAQQLGLARA